MSPFPFKSSSSPAFFADAWLVALCEGYDHLEMDLLFRLRSGEPRDAAVKHDNATALRLLLAHKETRAKYQALQENVSAEQVRASIDAKLARLREQVLAREAEAAAQAGPDAV